MRTFAQKPEVTQQTTSAGLIKPSRAFLGQSREVSPIHHLQRTIGNQAVQRLLQANPRSLEAESDTTATSGFAHDFSRLPVNVDVPVQTRTKLTISANTFLPLIQREEGEGSQPTQSAPQASQGIPTDAMFYITNPGLETDRGLQAALNLLNRYSSHVPINIVEIRLLPESERPSMLGHDLQFAGDSFWEGNIPVVRLPQAALNAITQHVVGNAPVADVHAIIRTIGHEMHHLWREREQHRANPIWPIYETEATQRMERVRQNWVRAIQSGTSRIAGVPQTITSWEDIPESEQERIERGASRTDYIQGLYERSAYIVEEIYTRIEELAFLRVQQQHEVDSGRTPSRVEVSEVASIIFRLRNMMESIVGPDRFVTPQLWQQAQQAMLDYLRQRYPNHQNPQIDSFEVLFYLNAMHRGMPPLFVSGRLQSTAPPGARLP